MIKLKSLLKEEKLAFQMEREGKIRTSTVETPEITIINMFSTTGKRLGFIRLKMNTPDLGDKQPKPGYLFIDWVEVVHKKEGFGTLLYEAALRYCKKIYVKGLVSGKDHRIPRTDTIWKYITTSSDFYYDYADVKKLELENNQY